MTKEIAILTKRIENDPSNAWLYRQRGWLHCEARDWKLALEDFSKAIVLEPDEPEFWRSRGRLNEHLGHITLYQRDLDRAVELDPEDAVSYDTRGWCHKLNHCNDLALADFDRAIALNPREPEYRCRRGLVWLEKRELPRALEDLDHAIRLDPGKGRYYHERAKALLYENPAVKPEEALPDLEEAIRLDPEKAWYRMDRAYIRYCQGRWSEAAEDFLCQDFRYMYSIAPYLGAERVVWIYLARLFEGHPTSGLDAIEEYLNWYLAEPAGLGQDQPPAQRLETWPVPLARFLKGDLEESQLLDRPDLDPTRPDLEPWQQEKINNRIGECHFVLAQQRLAQANPGEALLHLRKANGLPPRNPMRWVVERQIACYG